MKLKKFYGKLLETDGVEHYNDLVTFYVLSTIANHINDEKLKERTIQFINEAMYELGKKEFRIETIIK